MCSPTHCLRFSHSTAIHLRSNSIALLRSLPASLFTITQLVQFAFHAVHSITLTFKQTTSLSPQAEQQKMSASLEAIHPPPRIVHSEGSTAIAYSDYGGCVTVFAILHFCLCVYGFGMPLTCPIMEGTIHCVWSLLIVVVFGCFFLLRLWRVRCCVCDLAVHMCSVHLCALCAISIDFLVLYTPSSNCAYCAYFVHTCAYFWLHPS